MHYMISKSNVKFTIDVTWMVESLLQNNAFALILLQTIIRFDFCDILDNQGLGKCYQPWSLA